MSNLARPRRTARMAATAGTALVLCAGAAAATTGGALLDPITGDDSPSLAASDDDPLDDGAPAAGASSHIVRAPDEGPAEPASIFDDPAIQDACDTAESHGAFVSGVARDKVEGEHHGTRVSEAAHSTCGKPDKPDKPDRAEHD